MAEPNYNIGEFNYANSENYGRRRPLNTVLQRSTSGRREHPSGESQTVQGETMSIKEIMARALNGIAPIGREFPYFDQEDLDNIRSFPIDLTDLDNTREEIENLGAVVTEAIAARDAEEAEEPEVPEEPEAEGDGG